MHKHDIDIEALNSLIGLVYDAANEPDLWQELLASMAKVFDCHGAVFRMFDARSGRPLHNLIYGHDQGFSQNYNDHFYKLDVTTPLIKHAPEGAVLRRNVLIEDKTYTNTEYYNDFARHWGVFDVMGGHFVQRGEDVARIGLHRAVDNQPFSERDEYLFSLLVPHLQRAYYLSRHIQSLKSHNESTNEVLEKLPYGIVLVNEFARPIWVSNKAKTICHPGSGMTIKTKGLYAQTTKQTEELAEIIHHACGLYGDNRQGGGVSLNRAVSDIPLSVMVTPLYMQNSFMGFQEHGATAIVFISDPANQQQISSEGLSSLYGLTKAEARLAQGLAQGLSMDDISDLHHVSKHTLRTQLKSIFNKTGLNRQADLVRLIIGGPGILSQ